MRVEMVAEVRWQCPGCGRFVPHDGRRSEDHVDPGAYYGITTETWADCKRCGRVDNPRCVPIYEYPMAFDDEPAGVL